MFLVLGAIVLLLNQSAALKKAIETVGPTVTGTPVTADSTVLSIFTGTGSVENFAIANPEGFSEKPAISAGKLDLKVQSGSLFTRHIVIEELTIENPVINYEIGLSGINIEQIKDFRSGDKRSVLEKLGSILESAGEDGPPTPAAGEKNAPKYEVEIRKLSITGAQLTFGSRLFSEGGAKVNVPDVHLENFTSGEGISVPLAFKLVLTTLIDAAVKAALNNPDSLQEGGGSFLDSLRKSLDGGVEIDPKLQEDAKGVLEGLKGIFGGGEPEKPKH
ncbi:MAG: hypothetical protein HKN23_20575 [Verrucomicrobiales bacterium]|nr:hypothetical protein [Verrucomicrobiales bacterium]